MLTYADVCLTGPWIQGCCQKIGSALSKGDMLQVA
jgi:hypothetical protein